MGTTFLRRDGVDAGVNSPARLNAVAATCATRLFITSSGCGARANRGDGAPRRVAACCSVTWRHTEERALRMGDVVLPTAALGVIVALLVVAVTASITLAVIVRRVSWENPGAFALTRLRRRFSRSAVASAASLRVATSAAVATGPPVQASSPSPSSLGLIVAALPLPRPCRPSASLPRQQLAPSATPLQLARPRPRRPPARVASRLGPSLPCRCCPRRARGRRARTRPLAAALRWLRTATTLRRRCRGGAASPSRSRRHRRPTRTRWRTGRWTPRSSR